MYCMSCIYICMYVNTYIRMYYRQGAHTGDACAADGAAAGRGPDAAGCTARDSAPRSAP